MIECLLWVESGHSVECRIWVESIHYSLPSRSALKPQQWVGQTAFMSALFASSWSKANDGSGSVFFRHWMKPGIVTLRRPGLCARSARSMHGSNKTLLSQANFQAEAGRGVASRVLSD